MFAIDEIAYASPFRDWSPLGKFALALSLLVSSLVASSIAIPILVFLIGFCLLFYSTRMRFPRVIVLALLDGLAVFFIGALVIALITTGDPLWSINLGFIVLNFSNQGVSLGLLVFMRAVAGVTVMLFFATSTPIPHLANALRQVKIPAEIVELTILVYRYAFLLLEQLETMYIAAHSRLGFRGLKTKFRTTAKLMVGIFTRSLEVAERSQVALNCRSFRGEFHCYRPPARITAKWVFASIIVFELLFIINLLLVNPAPLTASPLAAIFRL
ncbi:MAG: cobalt ECF transporter T component CbiQ [Methanomassiliicoccales archaeon]|jgi:cobalt ECF transporter T component CbiQ